MRTHAHVCSRMLTYAGVCSRMRTPVSSHQVLRMLTYAHVCSLTQTYAHVCALLPYVTAGSSVIVPTPPDKQLTYGHVCSRMLTYAHVCSRVLTYADRFFGYRIDTARQATYHRSVRQVCSRILTYAHVRSRMLTYAHDKQLTAGVCLCTTSNLLLTYAHVCSRMLTYAHVCSCMLTTSTLPPQRPPCNQLLALLAQKYIYRRRSSYKSTNTDAEAVSRLG